MTNNFNRHKWWAGLNLIEDIIEEVLIKVLPEAELEREEIEEIKESIKEMKKGNFVTLEELKSA